MSQRCLNFSVLSNSRSAAAVSMASSPFINNEFYLGDCNFGSGHVIRARDKKVLAHRRKNVSKRFIIFRIFCNPCPSDIHTMRYWPEVFAALKIHQQPSTYHFWVIYRILGVVEEIVFGQQLRILKSEIQIGH